MKQLYRADGVLDLDRVQRTKIVLIGAGSLGSMIAENLLLYPWRSTVIADPDTLGVENVERHLLGPEYLGKPKVEGIRDWMVDRGVPADTIVAHPGKIQEILYEHCDAQIAIVSVDNRRVKTYIDNWARQNDVPLLIGGVYPRGSGGHSIFLPDPKRVCYACVAHLLGEDAYRGKQDANYGVDITELLNENGDLIKVPSLRAPVAAIAADMAMMAIRYLEGGDVPAHILYHAFGWETVLTLAGNSSELRAIVGYMGCHRKMGFLPHMRLEQVNGRYNLNIFNGTLPVGIEPWADCPNHLESKNSNSLEEI